MKNELKARLKQRDLLHGLFVMLPAPAVVEMVGYAGFDYAVLDTEHGAAGAEMLENQLRAADACNLPTLVRTADHSTAEILRAMEAGATGVLIPHVTTAAEAAAVVRAAHYPPTGTRGIATTSRAGQHGMVTVADHLRNARESTVVMVQIEDAAALPNIGAIARTAGVDAVFIGPADLAMSLGFPGELGHPAVVAAIQKIVDEVTGAGQVLAGFARAEEDAQALAQQGITFICMSTTLIFSKRLVELAKRLKQ